VSEKFRFGDFVQAVSVRQVNISYNDLAPRLKKDADGNDIKYQPPRLKLRPMDVRRLLQPYVGVRIIDQIKSVVPLALYLVLFQVLILRQGVADSWAITGGLVAVILGLMLFMEGLTLGLMPFGEIIGNTLPKKTRLPMVLFIAFLLGVGVTFAEPAIGALKEAGKLVDVHSAPYLFALLNEWTTVLVLVVGAGVGLAAIIGTLRFLYGWSLKPLIYISLVPTVTLTVIALIDPEVRKVVGLAWDCGAVTTGPVTVPLVLSLGIGVASAVGEGAGGSLKGFGIVTLASLFPITAVLCLAMYIGLTQSPEEIIAEAGAAASMVSSTKWYQTTPFPEIIGGVRAIVPLIIFLFIVMKLVLREKIREAGMLTYGIILAVVGMCIFNIGLTHGLAALGDQSGGLVPAAFAAIEQVPDSPLYMVSLGIGIAVLFAWFLGFGATLAEPALNALGITVQNLTNGAFKKSLLMYAVSFGVAFGIALGVAKLIFDFHLAYLLLPGYAIALLLTVLSTEEFVNVAWDSAGVTTGPVTVPLVLAMGLGFGGALNSIEGFGILSLASICPIISVMSVGLFVRWRIRRDEATIISSTVIRRSAGEMASQ
jgi:hypothetical protein